MKESIDSVATFLDGGKLPCLLVINNDELSDKEYEDKINELKEFASSNSFCGLFRTSSKTGLNINESMDYLINNFIERIEAIEE